MYTNPRASALMQTLKAFQAVMLAVTLVTLSFPVTPFTARAQEDTTIIPAVEATETTPEEDVVEEETPALDCEATGQVLNDDGTACVDVVEEPAPEEEAAPEAVARTVETVIAPPPYTYDDDEEDNKCVIVSDTYTYEGGQPAVIVSNPHSGWTAVLDSISKWIWGEDPTTLTAGDEVETFTRTFSVDELPSGATLRIAADNGFSVTVNGHAVGADPEEHNYQAGHENDYSIPASDLVAGENTLTFVVTNKDLSGETPANNPGGLRYVLTVDDADCGKPEVEVENSCLAPSAEGATGEITVTSAPGSEDDLADLIDAGLDVQDDQVNFQTWDATGNDVDFVVTYLGKKANSGDKHVWGWFNGATFTPVFRDADISAGADAYDVLPLLTVDGEQTTFSVTGVTDISFGILDTTSGKYYSTDGANTLNGDSADHAVVYNQSDDAYTIALEDLQNGGDHDFNDVVVSLTTECSPTEDTITVVATKIVCDDESDLPNVMGSNHQTTADTAANFMETHGESCHLEPGWQFEWANNGADGGNATVGHVAGYTTSGLTAANGTVTMSIPLVGNDEIHLREVLKDGYIPFKGGTSDNVSAEFACSNDGLNYDNWDFIRNPIEGNTYYCVAWNVEEEDETPTCDPKIDLVANGSFENPDVTNGAGWDVFDVGTSPALVWLADFIGAAPGGKVEIHGGVNGWLASDGSQYTELDSDLNGPSNPGGQSAVEIAQGLTTVNGQKYHVSYDFSPRPGTAKEQNGVTVSVNGVPMQTTNAANATAGNQTEWDSYGFDFTAGGVLTTLALRDAGDTNDSLGSFLDNVKVTCVPDETPTCDEGEHLEGDECVPNDDEGPYNVFISKYLWNGETAEPIAEETEAPEFTMIAQYTIANVYTNENPGDEYYLNDENNYATKTINLAEGDHYKTFEVTDGDVVIPAEGQCVDGKYRLKGYKVGSTPEAAAEAALTTTAPDFTITGDEYVIVVNERCGDEDGGGDDDTGTLIIKKVSIGGDDTFHFNVYEVYDEFVSKVLELFDGEEVDVETEDGTGESEEITLEEGEYNVTEASKDGWTLQDVTCEYENESEGEAIEGGEYIYIEAGETVICTFTNTKDGEDTNTEHTTIVSGNTSAGENLLGWMFNRDPGTQTPFEFSSAAAAIGSGSLFVNPITNTVVGNADKFIGELFLITPMDGLNSITYDFKIGSPDSTVEEQFYMSVYANFGESSPTKFYDCRYDVVPTTGSTAGFSTVTFDPSVTTYVVTTRGSSPHACPAAPQDMQGMSVSGTATVRAISLNVGDTSGSDTGVSGYLDKVVTSITTGSNTHTETYDFEPVATPSNPDDTRDGPSSRSGSGRGRSGGSSGDGEVLGASTCSPLLTQYLKMGWANDPAEVMKLQEFLNNQVGTALPLSGFFGPATFDAVKLFQKNYWEQVLKPWIGLPGSGIEGENTPTGFVYQTTRWQINNIWCPGSEAFPTTLN